MPAQINWFENFFHGVALDLWRQAIPQKQTEAEADFLLQALNCRPGSHVLDVPCGNGRLSFALARRGVRVTGLDISEEFIEEARRSTNDAPAAPTEFILGDKRALTDEAIYDGAYCFGNSFGFLEYEGMEKFLKGVRRALKPGAHFIVETGMAAESLLPGFEPETSHQIGDIKVITKEQYNAAESCVDSEYVMERDGKTDSRLAKHWIYTAAEIQRMLMRAGFAILHVYGSIKFEPYKLGAQELIVVAEARP